MERLVRIGRGNSRQGDNRGGRYYYGKIPGRVRSQRRYGTMYGSIAKSEDTEVYGTEGLELEVGSTERTSVCHLGFVYRVTDVFRSERIWYLWI